LIAAGRSPPSQAPVSRGNATALQLFDPGNLLIDDEGPLYITDYFNHRVWAVRYSDA
jgi:hypothetical protein